jgi:hypothetical protein
MPTVTAVRQTCAPRLGSWVREGRHPPGTADLGRRVWEMMLPTLDSLLAAVLGALSKA